MFSVGCIGVSVGTTPRLSGIGEGKQCGEGLKGGEEVFHHGAGWCVFSVE